MDKVRKPSNSLWYTPSSEPYRINKLIWLTRSLHISLIFVLLLYSHLPLDHARDLFPLSCRTNFINTNEYSINHILGLFGNGTLVSINFGNLVCAFRIAKQEIRHALYWNKGFIILSRLRVREYRGVLIDYWFYWQLVYTTRNYTYSSLTHTHRLVSSVYYSPH
jgi:hypothetical protein